MKKKIFNVMIILCIVVASVVNNTICDIYAADDKINPDDMVEILNEITIAGQAWESIGFDSEDIAEIMQFPRKDTTYFHAIKDKIDTLSTETEATIALENTLEEQDGISLYAQDGNPPETPQEQNERIKYITQIALNRYGNTYNTDDFNKYILYLYMSHYIDNPNYTKDNPGFDDIYAYVITSDDIRVYKNFIEQSKFSMFSTNLVNFVNELKSAGENITELKRNVGEGKTMSANVANSVYGLSTFNPLDTTRRADLIVTSFKNHYESTKSVEELLDAIYVDLEPENVGKQYIDVCVTGILGMLAETMTVFGFGMSISICYYNVYMNLYDKARLTALYYSLSGRIAIRLDALLLE